MIDKIKDIDKIKEFVKNYFLLSKEKDEEEINQVIDLIINRIKRLSVQYSFSTFVSVFVQCVNCFSSIVGNKSNEKIYNEYDDFIENRIECLNYQKKLLKKLKKNVIESKINQDYDKLTLQMYMLCMLLYYYYNKEEQDEKDITIIELKLKGLECTFHEDDFNEVKTKRIIRKISDKL